MVQPTASPSGSVLLRGGFGIQEVPSGTATSIGGVVGLDDRSSAKPIWLSGDLLIGVSAAPGGGLSRIDIIEVAYSRALGNPASKGVFDPIQGKFVPGIVNKSLSFALPSGFTVNSGGAINYKTGTPNASPVVPATDAGYVQVAQILVGPTATTFDWNVISDTRPLLFAGGSASAAMRVGAKTDRTLTPTLRTQAGPPGIRLYFAPNQSVDFELQIYAVGNFRSAVLTPFATDDAGAVLLGCQITGTGAGITTISSADQTLLNSVHRAGDPVDVAVGQPCAKWVVFPYKTNDLANPPSDYEMYLNFVLM